LRELDVPKSDKKKLKTIKKWIKEHIKPKGRFDYASYAEDDDD
jgi:hypothetical protein